MKLLFLNLYSGAVERGAESFVHELAQQLGQTHEVVFLKGNSTEVSEHTFSGNFFQRWCNRKRFFVDTAGLAILKFSVKQLSTIYKEKPDWVIPLNGFWQVLLLKLFQPLVGYQVLITGHSGPGWDERWNLYLHPNVFVATTGPTLTWAQKACPWTHSVLIPYGIDPGEFFPGEILPGIEKMPLDRPIILCPSALVAYKQVDTVIRAASKLNKGGVIILGKGPLEKSLKTLGQQLLGERFLLTSVSYQQMPQMYAGADIVTLPSSPQENSPMVYIEALAAGKPVVATDAPRVRWVLEEAGIYVDPHDTQGYAQALEKAYQTQPNTKKPLQKFLWENVRQQYEALITA